MPVRLFKNNTNTGVSYPSNSMHIEANVWNETEWVGLVDWSEGPFIAHYQGFLIDACNYNPSNPEACYECLVDFPVDVLTQEDMSNTGFDPPSNSSGTRTSTLRKGAASFVPSARDAYMMRLTHDEIKDVFCHSQNWFWENNDDEPTKFMIHNSQKNPSSQISNRNSNKGKINIQESKTKMPRFLSEELAIVPYIPPVQVLEAEPSKKSTSSTIPRSIKIMNKLTTYSSCQLQIEENKSESSATNGSKGTNFEEKIGKYKGIRGNGKELEHATEKRGQFGPY
ncbi:unnamed protein product [Fraxinus pennsylvanica]|uniref:Uncharacterized protein n=1 Tax=Fraxinus pennsylvanica TaxID=56036 RepID=A0AAD2DWI9_9LAMI|nr:unnamed protein product [Fraxinus pennsylvanica]